MGENLHVCCYERCGKSFAMPVRLTNLSHKPHSQTYLACPYCFSKVVNNDASEMDDIDGEIKLLQNGGYEIPSPMSGLKKTAKSNRQEDAISPVSCGHQVGYLKTRSKSEAFPDGCLTCPKILQCMV